jgi:hypothetical protein
MTALLRNPVVKLATALWWLPLLLVTAVALALGREHRLLVLLSGLAVCLGVAGATAAAVWAEGAAARKEAVARRREAGHRFLCPRCVRFGAFRRACGTCGTEVEVLAVETQGAYTDRCPQGHSLHDPPMPAFCSHCSALLDPAVYHARRVRVLSALTSRDFHTLRAEFRGEGDLRGVVVEDDGAELTYLLDLEELTADGSALPGDHAAGAVEAIWIGSADPLNLGKALDRFISAAEMTEERLSAVRVDAAVAEMEPAARRLIEARTGSARTGVGPVAFLRSRRREGGPQRAEEVRP